MSNAHDDAALMRRIRERAGAYDDDPFHIGPQETRERIAAMEQLAAAGFDTGTLEDRITAALKALKDADAEIARLGART